MQEPDDAKNATETEHAGETRGEENAAQQKDPSAQSGGDGERRPVQASFLQFVSGMFAQALMHLGAMSNPLTGKVEVDLVNARYSIDLLAILQEKTRGNLTGEEEEYLKNALYQLRMTYVQVTEREGKDEKGA